MYPVARCADKARRAVGVVLAHRSRQHMTLSVPPDPHPSTLYRDELYTQRLPSTCVAWASPAGRRMFAEALAAGHMQCYFPLSYHFNSQAEPTTCGLSTLAIILNALGMVDTASGARRQRVGSGEEGEVNPRPRFYDESSFDLSPVLPLGIMLRDGIDVDAFVACARAAGAHAVLTHAYHTVSPFAYPSVPPGSVPDPFMAGGSVGEDAFRDVVRTAAATPAGMFLALSYSRYELYQTGDGHFSPLGGYHAPSDSILIMDSAKFKYPPHWVPLPLMWAAMQRCDWTTGRPRGYITVHATQPTMPCGDGGDRTSPG